MSPHARPASSPQRKKSRRRRLYIVTTHIHTRRGTVVECTVVRGRALAHTHARQCQSGRPPHIRNLSRSTPALFAHTSPSRSSPPHRGLHSPAARARRSSAPLVLRGAPPRYTPCRNAAANAAGGRGVVSPWQVRYRGTLCVSTTSRRGRRRWAPDRSPRASA